MSLKLGCVTPRPSISRRSIYNKLAIYGIDPVKGFNVQMQFNLSLAVPEVPA